MADQVAVGRALREHARRRLIGAVLVLLVLLAGGAATTLATMAVDRGHKALTKQAMDRAIDDFTGVITDEVSHYAFALDDVAIALGNEDELTDEKFLALTRRLNEDRLPGIGGVWFAVPAYDEQVAETQARWRARGAAGLSLYRTGADVEHKFIVFGRSFNGPQAGAGRDLSTTAGTEDALVKARKTRGFTMSAAHIAMRDRQLPADRQKISVTMAQPIYGTSGAFQGWVVIGVRGEDFLLPELDRGARGAVRLRLTDMAPEAGQTIVKLDDGTLLDEPGLDRSGVIVVGQRAWHLTLQPTTKIISETDQRLLWLTPATGAALTLTLAVLVGVLAGSRARAMDKVDQKTAALRQDIAQRMEVEDELRRSKEELHKLAFHDQLTGLANRNLFYDRVGHALLTHAREGRALAVFFIDLDGFKEVNDALGHSAGDAVLRETAGRLRSCLRESDTVARFGGDEFAVVAERLADPADVLVTADRIVRSMRRPIQIGQRTVTVTASVGIALNQPGDTADDILRSADLAMYAAKTGGKSQHVLSGS